MAETLNHLEEMEWKPTPPPGKPKLEAGHDCGIKTTSVNELAASIEHHPLCSLNC